MSCEKAQELAKISKKMENTHSYDEWEELNEIAEELCYKISICTTKCGNNACYGLQNSDAIALAFEEEMADNSIYDSLPDDEFF